MCFFIREKNIEARDENRWKYRHTNYIFRNAGGEYIERKGKGCLEAGKDPLYEFGPTRSHVIPHRNRPRDDHTASPNFKQVNWDGGGTGESLNRKESPLGTTTRDETNSPKPVFKKVDWNAKGHPERSVSPRGTTSRLVSDQDLLMRMCADT